MHNNRVTFSSSNSDFITVGTAETIGSDGKTFYPTLVINRQLLVINGPFEFQLIGTDKGTPPRSGSATVIIKANEQVTYIPTPQFEHVLYRGKLDANKALSIDRPPQIVTETFSNEITFELTEGVNIKINHSLQKKTNSKQ